MLINIRDIPEGHSVIEQDVTMAEEQIKDSGFIGNVFCHVEIDRLQFQIYLNMSYTCRVIQECSRCLNAFEYPMHGSFSLVLHDRNAPENSLNDDEEFFDYCFNEYDTTIDIRRSLYEEVLINLPIKPLCKADCQGVMDYEKNASANSGLKNTIDPRWEALKKLKKNIQENT